MNSDSQPIKQEPVSITGIWTRRIGDHIETLLEVDGQWVMVHVNHFDGPFSHITEPTGIRARINGIQGAPDER